MMGSREGQCGAEKGMGQPRGAHGLCRTSVLLTRPEQITTRKKIIWVTMEFSMEIILKGAQSTRQCSR